MVYEVSSCKIRKVTNILKSSKINYENITIKDGKTFRWGGRYNKDFTKRDTLFTELGVFEAFKPSIKTHPLGQKAAFKAIVTRFLVRKMP